MKKWDLNIRNGCKSPQNPFFGAFMGGIGHIGGWDGTQNRQIEFNYIGPALF